MALLWCDGFEAQDHASLYQGVAGTLTSGTSTRFGAGRCLDGTGTSRGIQKVIDDSAEVFVGVAFKGGGTLSQTIYVDFYGDNNVTQHIRVQVNSSGAIEIQRAVTIATSASGLIALGVWYYLEVHVKVADAGGAVEVRLDGNSTPVVTFSGDTKNGGTSTNVDGVRILGGGSSTWSIDDLYVCNSTGTLNNGFLGDVRVQTLFPSGAGSSTALTPSAGSNYQTVDEAPPSATDYSGSATSGARDTYAMDDLLSGTTAVHGVRATTYWHKSDAGAASMKRAMKVGASVYYGSTVALPSSMAPTSDVQDTSPATSSAWTVSEVDGAELGAEVV